MGVEREIGPNRYLAHYDEYDDGKVCVTRIGRKEGDEWVRDHLGSEFIRELEADLEAQIEREQQAMVASYDEERRRFG